MTKIALSAVFFLAFAFSAVAQVPTMDLSNYGVKIEPDKRLMVVLAAMEMAAEKGDNGQEKRLINTPLTPSGDRFRQKLQADLTDAPADLKQKISTFVSLYKKRHAKATDAETIAPFVSMAYALTPVPELNDPVVTTDLPGDLLDVLDFAPLVREFYRRSGISSHLDEYVKLYQQETDAKLRPSAKDMIADLLDYLHTKPQTIYLERKKTQSKVQGKTVETITPVEHDRRFFIVPELLAPAGNITFLNIHDDYYVVLPADTDLNYSEARRAYLQYVFDALTLTNSKDIFTKKDGIKALLDERRKNNPDVSPDVFLTVTRSLVAAADARQLEYSKVQLATQQARQKLAALKTDAEKKAVTDELAKYKASLADETALRLSEEYERGSVLDFYFADQLKGTEDSGFDIASSLREMVLSLDTTKEGSRLEQNADARKRALAARAERKNRPEVPTAIVENPVTTKLLEIQKTIEARNYSQADAALKELQKTNPNEPRIYYNMGRVASLQAEAISDPDALGKKLLEAKADYENVLGIAEKQQLEVNKGVAGAQPPDRALVSLTYVALAKIYEFYDQKDYALKIYDAAIKVGDVANGAYKEAMDAKQRLLKNP